MIQEIDIARTLSELACTDSDGQQTAGRPFPALVSLADLDAHPPDAPLPLIENVLSSGDLMMLSGASKTNKSWCLLNLALAVGSGGEWWGHKCEQAKILYVNLELTPYWIKKRLDALRRARGDKADVAEMVSLWNLRGYAQDFACLKQELSMLLLNDCYGLLVLDPVYKLLGNRTENSNNEMTELLNEIEEIAEQHNVAIIFAHHFAKGDPTAKAAQDRMSGAGAWMRYPDSSIILTAHEESNCFTVTSILRNHPPIEEFVLEWKCPLMRPRPELNPLRLRRLNSNKKMTDTEFIEKCIGNQSLRHGEIVARAKTFGMGESTAARYINQLTESGLLDHIGTHYARKTG